MAGLLTALLAASLAVANGQTTAANTSGQTCSTDWCNGPYAAYGSDYACWGGDSYGYGYGCACTQGKAVLTGNENWISYSYVYFEYTCCVSDDEEEDDDEDESLLSSSVSGDGEQCGLFTGCTDSSLCDSYLRETVDGFGNTREFTVITPPGKAIGESATSVIVALHGWTQSAQWACQAMLQPYVKDLDVIGVCPQAELSSDWETGWNTGSGDYGATASWSAPPALPASHGPYPAQNPRD